MSKVKLTTKEHVIHYLLGHISLGTYDRKFISNLESNFLGKSKSVTSNQAELLNRIISRYARQLSKQELNYNDLINLPWKKDPIPSEPEFTTAYAELLDEKIVIRTPYKSSFVKELKKTGRAHWNKEKREWCLDYSEPNIKQVVNLIAEHYDLINFSEQIKDILFLAEFYESVDIWNPTLVEVSGNLMVASTNEALHDAIEYIKLEKTPRCFTELTTHGISVSNKLITDKYFEFASKYNLDLENEDLLTLVEYLPLIGCKCLVITNSHSIQKDLLSQITHSLADAGITVYKKIPSDIELSDYVILYSMYIAKTSFEMKAMKLINITNSTSVKIK